MAEVEMTLYLAPLHRPVVAVVVEELERQE
jgi:hypothetical protein